MERGAQLEPPDVLVLGGGGILGEAWMSAVLAGLEEAAGFDPRRCQAYVGTSAGSIVSAGLVAGMSPRERLGALPQQPPVAADVAAGGDTALGRLVRLGVAAGGAAAGPFVPLALRSTAPGGALLRRAALSRTPPGRRSLDHLGRAIERMGARFDGRLLLVAVALESGRRVVFGAAGAPQVPVGAAVEASCAIPGVFRPIVVDGTSYVDGGVWSPTNMDVAPVRRGTQVLCMNPTGSLTASRLVPLGALGQMSRSVAAVEAVALERRGAKVTTVSPDAACVEAMGANLMDERPRSQVHAAGFAQGRALAGR